MLAIKLHLTHLLAIELHLTHLYECVWHHYFRTRNIVTLLSLVDLCCLRVIATRQEPAPLLATHYGSGVLDMCEKLTKYFTCV